MSDPSVAFQTAVYSALDAGLSVPIYDSVPQDATYPYVTIDYQDSSRANWLSDRKDQKIMYFSVWSDYRGQKEVYQSWPSLTPCSMIKIHSLYWPSRAISGFVEANQ